MDVKSQFDDFGDRLKRIRDSMEKINVLMLELQKKQQPPKPTLRLVKD